MGVVHNPDADIIKRGKVVSALEDGGYRIRVDADKGIDDEMILCPVMFKNNVPCKMGTIVQLEFDLTEGGWVATKDLTDRDLSLHDIYDGNGRDRRFGGTTG